MRNFKVIILIIYTLVNLNGCPPRFALPEEVSTGSVTHSDRIFYIVKASDFKIFEGWDNMGLVYLGSIEKYHLFSTYEKSARTNEIKNFALKHADCIIEDEYYLNNDNWIVGSYSGRLVDGKIIVKLGPY